MRKTKSYLDLCYNIEMIKAEIHVLKKQRREINHLINRHSSGPASYPVIRYHEAKTDRKYSVRPQLDSLWNQKEKISAEIELKEKDLKALEYRKKNIDKIIRKMNRPKNKIAILRETKGKTLAEIADELGYSESHIKRLSAEITQEISQEF